MDYWMLTLLLLMTLPIQEIEGRITDQYGKPIYNAKICSSRWNCANSDKEGMYKIEKIPYQEKVRFSCSGYKPVTVDIVGLEMNIIMKNVPVRETEWILPICSKIHEKKGRYIGTPRFKIFIPEDISIKEDLGDADYWTNVIHHASKSRQDRLIIGGGFSWSTGLPLWNTLPQLTEIIDKDVIDKYQAQEESSQPLSNIIDLRGNTKDGKHWRFTGDSYWTMEYQDVSEQSSSYFDKIIDSLCIDLGDSNNR